MKEIKMNTALKKAKNGEFEFIYDAKPGVNEIRKKSPNGIYQRKQIYIRG